ncbi:unnamed protein product [Caenorhabditis auriculariae]|uniref:Fibronectin type-III domain-containing protein n=1 Tax=Caenorhabditis auriculariae TaxID=2777116 RepID=A0A8S1HDJ9_9PELO|nr:unnamed protein product [Caenorhabditis auriculariae]
MKMRVFMRLFPVVLLLSKEVLGVARFAVSTLSDTSLVLRIVDASNVSSFDITVHIFDVQQQSLFRRTHLKHATSDQLLAFDGLRPATWFAVRVEYRLFYKDDDSQDADGIRTTKQEMVVKTKKTEREDPKKVDDMVAFINDLFVTKDNIYIGVGSVFKDSKKVATVIVPELKCSRGIVSPISQQVIQHASFHFDLSKLPKEDRKCSTICVFPYLRFQVLNGTSETFRGREWCGTVEDAKVLLSNDFSSRLYLLCFLLFLVYNNLK